MLIRSGSLLSALLSRPRHGPRPCTHLAAASSGLSGKGEKRTLRGKATLNFPDQVSPELAAKVKHQATHKVHGSGEWSLYRSSSLDIEETLDSSYAVDELPSPDETPQPGPPILLRSYQAEAVTKVLESFEGGIRRQLIHMATGAGKTVTFCSLARALNEQWTSEGREDARVLILVHREELVHQTVATFKRVWPKADIGIVRGGRNEFQAMHVVVATVQTASGDKRLEQLLGDGDVNVNSFGLCIIDEAHHAPARSYQVVLERLSFLQDSKKLLLGVTATPFRHCKKLLLSDTFDHTAYEISVFKLIEMGMLAKIKARRIMTEVDLAIGQDTDSDKDFNASQLEVLINSPERNALVAKSYQDLGEDRKAVAFCVSISHAEGIAAALRDIGISSQSLHSKLSNEERARVLAAHRSGDIKVLTNVSILTEGYDDTAIACILMCRPTKSPGLYSQCIGRGLRLHPGKGDCLILDFTDRDHVLDRPSDLISIYTLIPELLPPLLENRKITKIDDRTMDLRPSEELDLKSKLMLPWILVDQLDSYFAEFYKSGWPGWLVRVKLEGRGVWQTYYKKKYGSWKEEDWIALGDKVVSESGNKALMMIESKGLVKTMEQEIGFNPFKYLKKKSSSEGKPPCGSWRGCSSEGLMFPMT